MPVNQIATKHLSRLPLTALIICCASLHAQTPNVPDWQTKAGGKMQFDVASVRLDGVSSAHPPSLCLPTTPSENPTAASSPTSA